MFGHKHWNFEIVYQSFIGYICGVYNDLRYIIHQISVIRLNRNPIKTIQYVSFEAILAVWGTYDRYDFVPKCCW